MKPIAVLEFLSVPLVILGSLASSATAAARPAISVQIAPIIVAPPVVVEPEPVVVVPAPVVVVPVPQPVVVVPAPAVVVPVAYEPYPVVESGVTILVDPEDYYYQNDGRYYHHRYESDKDIVVKVIPNGQHFLHGRIDIDNIPEKHFHHPLRHHPILRAIQKNRENRDDRDSNR